MFMLTHAQDICVHEKKALETEAVFIVSFNIFCLLFMKRLKLTVNESIRAWCPVLLCALRSTLLHWATCLCHSRLL